jgi:hypothetical protein
VRTVFLRHPSSLRLGGEKTRVVNGVAKVLDAG